MALQDQAFGRFGGEFMKQNVVKYRCNVDVWLFVQLEKLMSAEEYKSFCEEEAK